MSATHASREARPTAACEARSALGARSEPVAIRRSSRRYLSPRSRAKIVEKKLFRAPDRLEMMMPMRKFMS